MGRSFPFLLCKLKSICGRYVEIPTGLDSFWSDTPLVETVCKVSHQDREIPQKGRFLALDVGTDGPHSLSRHQTRMQLNLGKGEGSCGVINTQQTYIYATQRNKCD